ncbi:MAG: 8-amino-7-oxononanoate synthase [Pseudomonadota bacterium]
MRQIERAFADFIADRKNNSNFRDLKSVGKNDARTITVDNAHYINVSSNDYLGLSHHPELIKAAQDATARYGSGAGASRLVTGNLDIFGRLEDKVAQFKGKEAALIMVSGFQANASVLPALFDKKIHGKEPLIFTDKLNHASMHLGCAASGVAQIRYAHNDMTHLESLLDKHTENDAPKFILTESVFSMDGDIAKLDEIYHLAEKHDCFVIIDEAHATGVMGPNGSGLAHGADLVIGTFSKAFGAFGAYVACSQDLKDYLINKCSGLIYATALPPSVLGSIEAALELVPNMEAERTHLQDISQSFRAGVQDLGYDTGPSETQIVPVIIGDSGQALDLSERIKTQGFWANAIRPPTVPQGSARIRCSFSAGHTHEDIKALLYAFAK